MFIEGTELSRTIEIMSEKISSRYYLLIFLKMMSFFPWKTDQNSLRLIQIMLTNGADDSAVHSISNFFGKLSKRLVNFGKYVGNILNFNKQ